MMWILPLFLLATVTATRGDSDEVPPSPPEVPPPPPEVPPPLPSPPNGSKQNYITYYLYNQENIRGKQFQSDGLADLLLVNNHTAVIVHGHRGHFEDDFSNNVRRAFTDNYDYNVIVMDWAFLAGGNYLQVVRDVPQAAEDLAILLQNIMNHNQEYKIHVVGFGIGAHLAGNAGRRARSLVGRITGLDPTGMAYNGINTLRLSRDDAEYVEVIHTDGGFLGNGIGSAIGHVDFFVNGGYSQPGCLTNSCCHRRSWELFAASLHPLYSYLGFQCDSMIQVNFNTCRGRTLIMGEADIDKNVPTPDSSALYRVNTGRTFPYV